MHAQHLHARLHREGEVAEGLPELDAVVALGGQHHVGELAVAPVELAAFDQHAADRGAVAAHVLRGRVHDDVGAPVERPAQVGRGHRVVDHQRQLCVVRDRRHPLDVEHVDLRIAKRLAVEQARVRLDRAPEVLRLIGIDEGRRDAHLGQRHRELRVGAAVEQRRRHDVVARLQDRQDRRQLCGHAAGGGQRGATVFQRRDAFLEHRHRRVGDARVDVAEGLQVEQAGGVVGRVEHVARGLVDRLRATAGDRIGQLAGVQAEGFDAEMAVAHGCLGGLFDGLRCGIASGQVAAFSA
jgi:hypothetical protein